MVSQNGFEILYITEGDGANPSVEIQFNEQRLCVIRKSEPESFVIEFVTDLYVLSQDVEMIFPLRAFNEILSEACLGLDGWLANITAAQP